MFYLDIIVRNLILSIYSVHLLFAITFITIIILSVCKTILIMVHPYYQALKRTQKHNKVVIIFAIVWRNGQPETDMITSWCFNVLIMKTHLLLSIWRIHLLYRYAPSALFMALSQQTKQLPTECLQHAPLLTLACVLLQSKHSTDWLKWIRNTTLSDMHWMEMLKYIWPWRTSNCDVEMKHETHI